MFSTARVASALVCVATGCQRWWPLHGEQRSQNSSRREQYFSRRQSQEVRRQHDGRDALGKLDQPVPIF